MKEVVGFGTAKRLKKAGFPQPEKRIGQIWYGDRLNGAFRNYCPFFIGKMLNSYRCLDGQRILLENHIFAPSATDILNHMRGNYRLSCSNFAWWCDRVEECPDLADEFRIVACFNDENPAEACAAAWLSVNEKK